MPQKKKTKKEINEAIQNWLDSYSSSKKATIKDVAQIAGVSKNTISRIINNSPLVKDETRLVIKTIIEKIGYQPDPQARGLAFRHSFLIGMIYGNPNPHFVLNLQQGILDGLDDTDYELVVRPCYRSNPNYLSDIQAFVERMKLAGVILTPSLAEDETLAKMLRNAGCKYIRISPSELDDEKNIIVTNDRIGATEAADYLSSLGHTQIACILGRSDLLSSKERLEGFRESLRANKIHLPAEYLVKGDFTFESGTSATQELLALPNPPTAIFASNDEMAAGALHAIRLAGLEVPGDLSVVGYDDFHVAVTVWPRLTTLRSPIHVTGKLAVQKLLSENPSDHSAFPDIPSPTLVVRESTSPPKP